MSPRWPGEALTAVLVRPCSLCLGVSVFCVCVCNVQGRRKGVARPKAVVQVERAVAMQERRSAPAEAAGDSSSSTRRRSSTESL